MCQKIKLLWIDFDLGRKTSVSEPLSINETCVEIAQSYKYPYCRKSYEMEHSCRKLSEKKLIKQCTTFTV